MSEGSVYQRSEDGLWCASLQVNGRRKTVYASTTREARQKLAELQREYAKAGLVPQPGNKTLNDLLDLWLESINIRAATEQSYSDYVDRHVRPELGEIRLRNCSLNTCSDSITRCKNKG